MAEPELKKSRVDDARARFLEVYQDLRAEILGDTMLTQPDAKEWIARMMDYNVPGGKLNRGLSVCDTLLGINPDASEDDQLQAHRLGWAIEYLQAYFLVADDIMDASVTRRGQPCWYRNAQVGLVAINDGILLEQHIYCILRKHFREHPAYVRLLELFLETTHKTAHGQLLDLITAPPGKVDLAKFSLQRYMDIVTFKTAYYSFYLPVACGMLLSGVRDEPAFEKAREILISMGQYFQIQDDYLDAFSDPETLGKIGTDIQDNKCSWLICTALQLANDAQRDVVVQNYGRADEACIERIKSLYRELKLEDKFRELESESHARLKGMIAEQQALPARVFESFLAKIYKRTK